MDPRLKKAIVAGCLGAFAVDTFVVAHWIGIGHALPSALQFGTAWSTSASTATTTSVFVTHFGNTVTEAVYANVAGSTVLKHDGQVQPPPKG